MIMTVCFRSKYLHKACTFESHLCPMQVVEETNKLTRAFNIEPSASNSGQASCTQSSGSGSYDFARRSAPFCLPLHADWDCQSVYLPTVHRRGVVMSCQKLAAACCLPRGSCQLSRHT